MQPNENALAVRQQGELAAPVVDETSILAVIARAASDPTVDVQKMQALLDMQFRVMERQSEMAYYAAMARLQPRLPRIARGGVNTHTKKHYSRYEDIDAGVRGLMNDEGFSASFTTEDVDERTMRVHCILAHSGGFRTTNSIRLPTEKASSAMNQTQASGSALTYAKRMLLTAALNLVSEGDDDDANRAGGGGYITESQAMDLQAALEAIGPDAVAGFCKWLQIRTLTEVPESRYREALSAIEKKRREPR